MVPAMAAQTFRNRQWIYASRPPGPVSAACYRLTEATITDELAPGEALIAARYLSVDPYMRIQQAARPTWEAPHPLGVVQRGAVVAQVVAVAAPDRGLAPGDWVTAGTGWQELARCPVAELVRVDPAIAPPSTALGALGMPGRTAWFGLMDAGRPRPGDTLVVSGAAGAVGSLVVQFGRLAGCRVVGIAGGPAKCTFVVDELGAHAAIDYQQHAAPGALDAELARLAPAVDVYFDNVGGVITDAVLPRIALRARVVICGQVSQYDGALDAPSLGPRFLHHLLFQRATIQGVLARDSLPRMDEYLRIAGPLVRDRKLIARETIIDGFDQLPAALADQLRGGNIGKMIVRVAA
jgi:NADPH-dependent curcumin reductase CurA